MGARLRSPARCSPPRAAGLGALVLGGALLGLVASPAAAQQAPDEVLEPAPDSEEAEKAEPEEVSTPPADPPPAPQAEEGAEEEKDEDEDASGQRDVESEIVEGAPPIPSEEELSVLEDTDPRFARPILRRVGRTAPDPDLRSRALLMLARRDASRATARICARVLRIDPAPKVRRAAAECLGRLPAVYASAQTSSLVAALEDDDVDVVTMAGWALANIGEPEALGEVAGSVEHPDRRVGRLFLDYADRLRTRHGLTWGAWETVGDDEPYYELVPPPGNLVAQVRGLEVTAATGWVAMYGGMAGWLHGGLFVAAFGGPVWQNLSPLTAMGGAVGGMVIGGAYGFFRADEILKAHTVVQIGTLGTMVGYGAGVLSGFPPESGLNAASWGLAGTALGTGLGVAMVETLEPTPGSLALGATVALGSGIGFGSLALASRFSLTSAAGAAMLTGGALGGLVTVATAPYEVGLLPSVGATLGGATFAAIAGVAMGAYESFQLQSQLEFPFTAGSGWAVAAGYAAGAMAGGTVALLLPESWDPLLGGHLDLRPPSVAVVEDPKNPRQPIPVATLGGEF